MSLNIIWGIKLFLSKTILNRQSLLLSLRAIHCYLCVSIHLFRIFPISTLLPRYFILFFLHSNASLHYRSRCGYQTNTAQTYNLPAKLSNEKSEASSSRRHHPLPFIRILLVLCPSQRPRRRNSYPPPPFFCLLSFSWDA